MKIPVEKSIYRKVYLQLKTGFLTERPLFYDAIRIIPPPAFVRPSEKLPNLGGLEDRLIRNFQRKYPYHFEDFVSDHSDSTRYVAYNFAKRQIQRMNMGEREDVAFRAVEKEFLAELDSINAQLFDDVPPEEEAAITKEATTTTKEEEEEEEEVKDLEDSNGVIEEEEEGEGEETHVNDAELYKNESVLHSALRRELTMKQKQTMQNTINRIIANYKNENGNHIISRKLSTLEHFYDEKDPNAKSVPIPKSDFVYDYSYSNSDYIPQDDMEEEEEM